VGEGGIITRYTGNFTDYLEKRRAEERALEKAEKKDKAPKQEKPTRQKKLKFTFKEQHEFNTIEDDIAALEEAIVQVETDMSAAGSDYVKLQELTEKQTKLSAELEEKMDRWMYLTDLAERIAAQE
jgi:ATP-binding cassette subfamily F protein uup